MPSHPRCNLLSWFQCKCIRFLQRSIRSPFERVTKTNPLLVKITIAGRNELLCVQTRGSCSFLSTQDAENIHPIRGVRVHTTVNRCISCWPSTIQVGFSYTGSYAFPSTFIKPDIEMEWRTLQMHSRDCKRTAKHSWMKTMKFQHSLSIETTYTTTISSTSSTNRLMKKTSPTPSTPTQTTSSPRFMLPSCPNKTSNPSLSKNYSNHKLTTSCAPKYAAVWTKGRRQAFIVKYNGIIYSRSNKSRQIFPRNHNLPPPNQWASIEIQPHHPLCATYVDSLQPPILGHVYGRVHARIHLPPTDVKVCGPVQARDMQSTRTPRKPTPSTADLLGNFKRN